MKMKSQTAAWETVFLNALSDKRSYPEYAKNTNK